jgi:ATP-dependent DNA helicase RecG
MKKTGRPKLAQDAKKAHITGLRLRDDERVALEKRASEEGKTLSAWMRDTLVKDDKPVVASIAEQREFNFGDNEPLRPDGHTALWTPRDIWVHLTQRYIPVFKEDRRVEYKNHKNPDLNDLATYYSAFSNTPDGGVVVYGVVDKTGEILGCHHFSTQQLNEIESCHTERCPGAKPEFKRVPVVVNNSPSFCIAIYVPYVGKLVETNRGEAWIRYGESRHEMSD